MSLPTKAVLHAATYPRDPRPGTPCNITIAQFNDWLAEQLRQAKEQAWEQGAESAFYEPEIRGQVDYPNNPYRSQK